MDNLVDEVPYVTDMEAAYDVAVKIPRDVFSGCPGSTARSSGGDVGVVAGPGGCRGGLGVCNNDPWAGERGGHSLAQIGDVSRGAAYLFQGSAHPGVEGPAALDASQRQAGRGHQVPASIGRRM